MHILWNIFFFRYFTKNKEQRGIIFKILFCYFLGTGIIFEFFHNSCKKEFSKDFLSKSYSGLTNKLSQIFIILMEISLWPCTLFTQVNLLCLIFLQNCSQFSAVLIVLGHVDLLEEHYHFSKECSAKNLLLIKLS